jgi:hypothetical protein
MKVVQLLSENDISFNPLTFSSKTKNEKNSTPLLFNLPPLLFNLPRDLTPYLLSYLSDQDVIQLGGVARGLYIYTRSDDFWLRREGIEEKVDLSRHPVGLYTQVLRYHDAVHFFNGLQIFDPKDVIIRDWRTMKRPGAPDPVDITERKELVMMKIYDDDEKLKAKNLLKCLVSNLVDGLLSFLEIDLDAFDPELVFTHTQNRVFRVQGSPWKLRQLLVEEWRTDLQKKLQELIETQTRFAREDKLWKRIGVALSTLKRNELGFAESWNQLRNQLREEKLRMWVFEEPLELEQVKYQPVELKPANSNQLFPLLPLVDLQHLIFFWLDDRKIADLGAVNRAFYVFSRSNEFWKRRKTRLFGPSFKEMLNFVDASYFYQGRIVYRAVANYNPRQEDYLNFQAQDLLVLVKHMDSGWSLMENERYQQGAVPRLLTYIEITTMRQPREIWHRKLRQLLLSGGAD